MMTSKLPSLISIRSILKVGGIFSIEARDMDTKILSDPESNNTLARFLGQMAYLVTSVTLNGARSYVMHSAFLTQRMLVIIVAVVGVGVTIVVVVVVESSSVIKLSFVIT
ncbi:hypothetical protein Tco_0462694 [Tanacetum coccineum]